MFIVAECGLWSVMVSNKVVYNSVLLQKTSRTAEPWAGGSARRRPYEIQQLWRKSVVQTGPDRALTLCCISWACLCSGC